MVRRGVELDGARCLHLHKPLPFFRLSSEHFLQFIQTSQKVLAVPQPLYLNPSASLLPSADMATRGTTASGRQR